MTKSESYAIQMMQSLFLLLKLDIKTSNSLGGIPVLQNNYNIISYLLLELCRKFSVYGF